MGPNDTSVRWCGNGAGMAREWRGCGADNTSVTVVGVWQHVSGNGPRRENGATVRVPDLTPHTLSPWRALLGRPDPFGSRLLQPVRGRTGACECRH